MPMIDPLYSLSGFAVGTLVGMTGVGGGALMTPILILLFGVHPATAVGTDLLYAAATKTGGSLVHGLARSIDWRVVRRLASGSVPATLVTLAVLSHFNLNGDAARGLITLVLSVALVALSSVVAGATCVVMLVLLYPQMPIAKIIGSDIAHAVPLTLIAGLGHWMRGSVGWHIIDSLVVGSLPGIFIGSYFATRIPERALRLVLATTLFVVASRIAYDHATAASAIFTAFTRRAAP